MYEIIKIAHSLIRWIAFIALILAMFKAWSGYVSKGSWTQQDRKLGVAVIASLHLQTLLGLLLYVGLSPITKAAFANFGGAMKDATLRFWAVEHIFIAIIGVIAAQVGFTLSKKASEDRSRFLRAAVGYTFGLICIIAAIPWPFRANIGRALLPF